MPSFGEKLKQEREKRSITLEQISISTKIGTRLLQALEENKFQQLPGGIFNKGFVRAYARFVGLDEDETVADYLEASGEAAPPKNPAGAEPVLSPPPKPPEPSPSRPLPWGLFAILLLLLALSLALWSRRHQAEQIRTVAPAPVTESPVSQSPANTVAAAEPVTSAPATPPPDTSQPAKPQPTTKPAPKPAATSAANTSPAPSQAAPASTTPEEFSVVILAREDSWLSITADGNSVFSDTIVGGNQRSIHARKEVVIRAGNAGALDFVFNGKKLPPQGDVGDVRILTFGPGGLVHAGATPATPQ